MNDSGAATTPSLEIERKFLVTDPPECIDAMSGTDVVQGYLAFLGDGVEVRLRRKGNRYFQTVKGGGDMVRMEREIEMTPEQFGVLWPATDGKRVEKTRYEIAYDGLTIEFDTYHGQLEGLHTAEVEFASISESEAFVPPPWFGADVTHDSRYKNSYLALHGIPETSQSTCA